MSAKRSIKTQIKPASKKSNLSAFDQLDGWHPWQEAASNSYLLYPVRKLQGGRVAWFNFALAKEMGLLPKKASEKITAKLEKKLLETFCLRIVNEYDQENDIRYTPSVMKERPYMATRYLQLQHDDKTGRTSGDGRCIWNGVVNHKGKTWDVSSRGTGVTALAPGSVKSDVPLESGNTDHGYGCGLAEIDELYGSAIMAEIMHLNGFTTERMLAIIDIGEECAIGVRAGENLFRPAHLFMHLKQENLSELKRATDFLIDRQYRNKEWNFSTKTRNRYRLLLEEVCESFAQFAAQLEREYIFAWLDWDGDNVLSTAGIIDYGSVRQFGVRHDQYRYDDDDRFSTNLNEQKAKAKLTIQVFAQMVEYLVTGRRRPLGEFKNHPILERFEEHFDYYLQCHFLYQMGLKKAQREQLLNDHRSEVEKLFSEFQSLEKRKTRRKQQKVADGVNRPAIFNMRHFLRDFPELLLMTKKKSDPDLISAQEFCDSYKTDFASRNDLKVNANVGKRILKLQRQYVECLRLIEGISWKKLTKQVSERSSVINRTDRVTGNALINMVNEILVRRRQGLPDGNIMETMDEFIQSQVTRPDVTDSEETQKLNRSLRKDPLGRAFLTLVEDYREDI
ncbi:MAG: hypothetical protein HRT45_06540 [Bdellovibrionales bacterium]|nr:hypothetical protein [Bdellovibrionales bacterium]